MKRDYYEVLGVSRSATDAEIKKAYRRLAREHHPDVNKHDDEAETKFKEVGEAYEALKDPQKRRAYDQFGHARGPGGPGGPGGFGQGFGGQGFGFEDIFDVFFDGFGGGRSGRRSAGEAGPDLAASMTLTFKEAAFGVERELNISRPVICDDCHGSGAEEGTEPSVCESCGGQGMVSVTQSTILGNFSRTAPCTNCGGTGRVITSPCKTCHGEGRHTSSEKVDIKVPAGVPDGVQLKLSGYGGAGRRGGPAGSLYVDIHVKPHKVFERSGADVLVDVPISFSQAALGAELSVATLDGEEILTVPAGTQAGREFRLRGQGIPHLNQRGRGDQVINITVKTPKRLNDEQRRLLTELSEYDEHDAEHVGIIGRIKEAFGK